jgi:hypothetical protein
MARSEKEKVVYDNPCLGDHFSTSTKGDDDDVLDISGLGPTASLPENLVEGPLFWRNGFSNMMKDTNSPKRENDVLSNLFIVPISHVYIFTVQDPTPLAPRV